MALVERPPEAHEGSATRTRAHPAGTANSTPESHSHSSPARKPARKTQQKRDQPAKAGLDDPDPGTIAAAEAAAAAAGSGGGGGAGFPARADEERSSSTVAKTTRGAREGAPCRPRSSDQVPLKGTPAVATHLEGTPEAASAAAPPRMMKSASCPGSKGEAEAAEAAQGRARASRAAPRAKALPTQAEAGEGSPEATELPGQPGAPPAHPQPPPAGTAKPAPSNARRKVRAPPAGKARESSLATGAAGDGEEPGERSAAGETRQQPKLKTKVVRKPAQAKVDTEKAAPEETSTEVAPLKPKSVKRKPAAKKPSSKAAGSCAPAQCQAGLEAALEQEASVEAVPSLALDAGKGGGSRTEDWVLSMPSPGPGAFSPLSSCGWSVFAEEGGGRRGRGGKGWNGVESIGEGVGEGERGEEELEEEGQGCVDVEEDEVGQGEGEVGEEEGAGEATGEAEPEEEEEEEDGGGSQEEDQVSVISDFVITKTPEPKEKAGSRGRELSEPTRPRSAPSPPEDVVFEEEDVDDGVIDAELVPAEDVAHAFPAPPPAAAAATAAPVLPSRGRAPPARSLNYAPLPAARARPSFGSPARGASGGPSARSQGAYPAPGVPLGGEDDGGGSGGRVIMAEAVDGGAAGGSPLVYRSSPPAAQYGSPVARMAPGVSAAPRQGSYDSPPARRRDSMGNGSPVVYQRQSSFCGAETPQRPMLPLPHMDSADYANGGSWMGPPALLQGRKLPGSRPGSGQGAGPPIGRPAYDSSQKVQQFQQQQQGCPFLDEEDLYEPSSTKAAQCEEGVPPLIRNMTAPQPMRGFPRSSSESTGSDGHDGGCPSADFLGKSKSVPPKAACPISLGAAKRQGSTERRRPRPGHSSHSSGEIPLLPASTRREALSTERRGSPAVLRGEAPTRVQRGLGSAAKAGGTFPRSASLDQSEDDLSEQVLVTKEAHVHHRTRSSSSSGRMKEAQAGKEAKEAVQEKPSRAHVRFAERSEQAGDRGHHVAATSASRGQAADSPQSSSSAVFTPSSTSSSSTDQSPAAPVRARKPLGRTLKPKSSGEEAPASRSSPSSSAELRGQHPRVGRSQLSASRG